MDHVWQYAFYTDTSTVTVHIRRLRAKLEADPEHAALDRDGMGRRVPLRALSFALGARARRRRASCWSPTTRHGAWVTLAIVAPLAVVTVLAGEWIATAPARRAAAPVRARSRRSARSQLAAGVALFVELMFVSSHDALMTVLLAVYAAALVLWIARRLGARALRRPRRGRRDARRGGRRPARRARRARPATTRSRGSAARSTP